MIRELEQQEIFREIDPKWAAALVVELSEKAAGKKQKEIVMDNSGEKYITLYHTENFGEKPVLVHQPFYLAMQNLYNWMNEEEFLALLSRVFAMRYGEEESKYNFKKLKQSSSPAFVFTLLEKSSSFFENHASDGFIGVNKIIFEEIAKGDENRDDIIKVLLEVGLSHELAHESGMHNEFTLSRSDVHLTEKLCDINKINLHYLISSLLHFSNESLYLNELVERNMPLIDDRQLAASKVLFNSLATSFGLEKIPTVRYKTAYYISSLFSKVSKENITEALESIKTILENLVPPAEDHSVYSLLMTDILSSLVSIVEEEKKAGAVLKQIANIISDYQNKTIYRQKSLEFLSMLVNISRVAKSSTSNTFVYVGYILSVSEIKIEDFSDLMKSLTALSNIVGTEAVESAFKCVNTVINKIPKGEVNSAKVKTLIQNLTKSFTTLCENVTSFRQSLFISLDLILSLEKISMENYEEILNDLCKISHNTRLRTHDAFLILGDIFQRIEISKENLDLFVKISEITNTAMSHALRCIGIIIGYYGDIISDKIRDLLVREFEEIIKINSFNTPEALLCLECLLQGEEINNANVFDQIDDFVNLLSELILTINNVMHDMPFALTMLVRNISYEKLEYLAKKIIDGKFIDREDVKIRIIDLIKTLNEKGYKEVLKDPPGLEKIGIYYAGDAPQRSSKIARKWLTALPPLKTYPPADFPRLFEKVRVEKMQTLEYVWKKAGMKGDISSLDLEHDITSVGRTLTIKDSEGNKLKIKLLKVDEPLTFLYHEAAVFNWGQEQERYKDVSYGFPKPIMIDGNYCFRLDMDELDNNLRGKILSALKNSMNEAYNRKGIGFDIDRGYYAFSYVVPSDSDYDTYVNANTERKNFEESLYKAGFDLGAFAKQGIVHTALIDMFHALDEERRYFWTAELNDALQRHSAGAGRVMGWRPSCLWPNLGKNGEIRDCAELIDIRDILKSPKYILKEDGMFLMEQFVDRSIQFLMLEFLGEYAMAIAHLYADWLITHDMMPHWKNDKAEVHSLGLFMKKVYFSILSGYIGRDQSIIEEELSNLVDWDRMAKQIALFTTDEYISLVYSKKEEQIKELNEYFPKDIFGDDVIVNILENLGAFNPVIGFVGNEDEPQLFQETAALGAENSVYPIQEIILANYYLFSTIVAEKTLEDAAPPPDFVEEPIAKLPIIDDIVEELKSDDIKFDDEVYDRLEKFYDKYIALGDNFIDMPHAERERYFVECFSAKRIADMFYLKEKYKFDIFDLLSDKNETFWIGKEKKEGKRYKITIDKRNKNRVEISEIFLDSDFERKIGFSNNEAYRLHDRLRNGKRNIGNFIIKINLFSLWALHNKTRHQVEIEPDYLEALRKYYPSIGATIIEPKDLMGTIKARFDLFGGLAAGIMTGSEADRIWDSENKKGFNPYICPWRMWSQRELDRLFKGTEKIKTSVLLDVLGLFSEQHKSDSIDELNAITPEDVISFIADEGVFISYVAEEEDDDIEKFVSDTDKINAARLEAFIRLVSELSEEERLFLVNEPTFLATILGSKPAYWTGVEDFDTVKSITEKMSISDFFLNMIIIPGLADNLFIYDFDRVISIINDAKDSLMKHPGITDNMKKNLHRIDFHDKEVLEELIKYVTSSHYLSEEENKLNNIIEGIILGIPYEDAEWFQEIVVKLGDGVKIPEEYLIKSINFNQPGDVNKFYGKTEKFESIMAQWDEAVNKGLSVLVRDMMASSSETEITQESSGILTMDERAYVEIAFVSLVHEIGNFAMVISGNLDLILLYGVEDEESKVTVDKFKESIYRNLSLTQDKFVSSKTLQDEDIDEIRKSLVEVENLLEEFKLLKEQISKQYHKQYALIIRVMQEYINLYKDKMDAVKNGIEDEYFNVHQFLKEKDNVSVTIEPDAGLDLFGYRKGFGFVIDNIQRNSLEHGGHEDIKMKIHVREEKESLIIEIQDNGKGFQIEELKNNAVKLGLWTEEDAQRVNENEIIELIFDEHFSRSYEKTGTHGLGLFLCRKIIEDCFDGRLTALNIKDQEGAVQGARFRIVIPQATSVLTEREVGKKEIHSEFYYEGTDQFWNQAPKPEVIRILPLAIQGIFNERNWKFRMRIIKTFDDVITNKHVADNVKQDCINKLVEAISRENNKYSKLLIWHEVVLRFEESNERAEAEKNHKLLNAYFLLFQKIGALDIPIRGSVLRLISEIISGIDYVWIPGSVKNELYRGIIMPMVEIVKADFRDGKSYCSPVIRTFIEKKNEDIFSFLEPLAAGAYVSNENIFIKNRALILLCAYSHDKGAMIFKKAMNNYFPVPKEFEKRINYMLDNDMILTKEDKMLFLNELGRYAREGRSLRVTKYLLKRFVNNSDIESERKLYLSRYIDSASTFSYIVSLIEKEQLPPLFRLYIYCVVPDSAKKYIEQGTYKVCARDALNFIQKNYRTTENIIQDDSPWRNEIIKVLYLATWFQYQDYLVKQCLFITQNEFQRIAERIMRQCLLREKFAGIANAGFVVGREEMIEFRPRIVDFISVVAHELGHAVLAEKGVRTLILEDESFHELVGDIFRYAILELMGWEKEDVRALFREKYDDVFLKKIYSVSPGLVNQQHTAARAWLEDFFRNFYDLINQHRKIPAFLEMIGFIAEYIHAPHAPPTYESDHDFSRRFQTVQLGLMAFVLAGSCGVSSFNILRFPDLFNDFKDYLSLGMTVEKARNEKTSVILYPWKLVEMIAAGNASIIERIKHSFLEAQMQLQMKVPMLKTDVIPIAAEQETETKKEKEIDTQVSSLRENEFQISTQKLISQTTIMPVSGFMVNNNRYQLDAINNPATIERILNEWFEDKRKQRVFSKKQWFEDCGFTIDENGKVIYKGHTGGMLITIYNVSGSEESPEFTLAGLAYCSQEERPVGYAKKMETYGIDRMEVDKDSRGKGLAQVMIAHAIWRSKNLNISDELKGELFVHPLEDDELSIKEYYENLGFKHFTTYEYAMATEDEKEKHLWMRLDKAEANNLFSQVMQKATFLGKSFPKPTTLPETLRLPDDRSGRDKKATLPETYALGEKLGLTREETERELAPLVEELGVVGFYIYRMLNKSKIEWKGWMPPSEVWKITLKSRLIIALVAPLLAGSPILFIGLLIANSLYFGFTHEKNKILNAFAGFIFNMPFFVFHGPQGILISLLFHWLMNYSAQKVMKMPISFSYLQTHGARITRKDVAKEEQLDYPYEFNIGDPHRIKNIKTGEEKEVDLYDVLWGWAQDDKRKRITLYDRETQKPLAIPYWGDEEIYIKLINRGVQIPSPFATYNINDNKKIIFTEYLPEGIDIESMPLSEQIEFMKMVMITLGSIHASDIVHSHPHLNNIRFYYDENTGQRKVKLFDYRLAQSLDCNWNDASQIYSSFIMDYRFMRRICDWLGFDQVMRVKLFLLLISRYPIKNEKVREELLTKIARETLTIFNAQILVDTVIKEKVVSDTTFDPGTLPESYALARKWGISTKGAEVGIAPWAEELGVVGILNRIFRTDVQVGWKGWLRDALKFGIIVHFFAGSPFGLGVVVSAIIVQTILFVITHEDTAQINYSLLVAGFLFNIPYILGFYSPFDILVIFVSIMMHFLFNFSILPGKERTTEIEITDELRQGLKELEKAIDSRLKKYKTAIVLIDGAPGVGKTGVARYIARNGINTIKPNEIMFYSRDRIEGDRDEAIDFMLSQAKKYVEISLEPPKLILLDGNGIVSRSEAMIERGTFKSESLRSIFRDTINVEVTATNEDRLKRLIMKEQDRVRAKSFLSIPRPKNRFDITIKNPILTYPAIDLEFGEEEIIKVGNQIKEMFHFYAPEEEHERIYVDGDEYRTYERLGKDMPEYFANKFLRVGNIIFVDSEYKFAIKNKIPSEYHEHIIFINALEFNLYNEAIINYVSSIIASILYSKDKIKDKTILDIGTGGGILGILALKLGARKIIGIDKDKNVLERVVYSLEANNLDRDRFLAIKHNLKDRSFNRFRILHTLRREIRNIGVVFANLGPHYGETNVAALNLLSYLPYLDLFFGAGYENLSDEEKDKSHNLTSRYDEARLRTMGFHSLADVTITIDEEKNFIKSFIYGKKVFHEVKEPSVSAQPKVLTQEFKTRFIETQLPKEKGLDREVKPHLTVKQDEFSDEEKIYMTIEINRNITESFENFINEGKRNKYKQLILIGKKSDYQGFEDLFEVDKRDSLLYPFRQFIKPRIVDDESFPGELSSLNPDEKARTVIVIPHEPDPKSVIADFEYLIFNPKSTKSVYDPHFVVFVSILIKLIRMVNTDNRDILFTSEEDFITRMKINESFLLHINNEAVLKVVRETIKQRQIKIAA